MNVLKKYHTNDKFISLEKGFVIESLKTEDKVVGNYDIIENQKLSFYTSENLHKHHDFKNSVFLKINDVVYDIMEISSKYVIHNNVIKFDLFNNLKEKVFFIETKYNEPMDRIGFTEYPEENNFLLYLHNCLQNDEFKKRILQLVNQ